ncbi:MAG: glycosyltransferase family 39 protein [Cyanobacteria bacterium P01_D01_bin.128]
MKRRWGAMLIAVLLLLGMAGRFTNLAHKLYWHDETYTTFRAAGYFASEIVADAFQGTLISPETLQSFQQLKPDSTFGDTLGSLAAEDPQHPPLYFLLARGWMLALGQGVVIARILPVLISLLSLPLMFLWGRSLAGTAAAVWATVMIALSPFDILYAQTNRQYSLLTVWAIASHWRLVCALQRPTGTNWGWYILVSALGLYTHPLFAIILITQGIYILIACWLNQRSPSASGSTRIPKPQILPAIAALATIGVLYTPWIWVMAQNRQTLQLATGWIQQSIPPQVLVKQWIRNFGALWVDIDFDLTTLEVGGLGLGLKLMALIVVPLALWTTWQRLPRTLALYLNAIIWVPFLLLAVPDVLTGGVRSAIARYVLPIMPGLQLLIGIWLSQQIRLDKPLWRVGLPLLLTGAIASNVISLPPETWWNKEPSFYVAAVAQQINQFEHPLLVSDQGPQYTNFGNLLSLSYRLDSAVSLLLNWQATNISALADWPRDRPALAYEPSVDLAAALENQGWQLVPIFADVQPAGSALFELKR